MYLIKLFPCLLVLLSWTLLTYSFITYSILLVHSWLKEEYCAIRTMSLFGPIPFNTLCYIYIFFFFLRRWRETTFLFEALSYAHRSVLEFWIAAANKSNFICNSLLNYTCGWIVKCQYCFEILLQINTEFPDIKWMQATILEIIFHVFSVSGHCKLFWMCLCKTLTHS